MSDANIASRSFIEQMRGLSNEYVIPFALDVVQGALWVYGETENAFMILDPEQDVIAGMARFVVKMDIPRDLDTSPVFNIGFYEFRAISKERTYALFIARSALRDEIGEGWESFQALAAFAHVHFIAWLPVEQARIDALKPAPVIERADVFIQQLSTTTVVRRRGMQERTRENLKRLRELRMEYVLRGEKPPALYILCQQVPMSSTTAADKDPVLANRWSDLGYRT